MQAHRWERREAGGGVAKGLDEVQSGAKGALAQARGGGRGLASVSCFHHSRLAAFSSSP